MRAQSFYPKDLFWQKKLTEQTEILRAELHQMRAKLQEFRVYSKTIAEAKQHFVVNDHQLHGILRGWQKDLDAIFSVAERLSK